MRVAVFIPSEHSGESDLKHYSGSIEMTVLSVQEALDYAKKMTPENAKDVSLTEMVPCLKAHVTKVNIVNSEIDCSYTTLDSMLEDAANVDLLSAAFVFLMNAGKPSKKKKTSSANKSAA